MEATRELCRQPGHGQSGFTLVELMVVILVVSILAAVAIPTYQYEIRNSRRTEAKTAVLDLAGREERYYSSSNQYTFDPTLLGYPAGAWGTPIGSGYYSVTAAAGATGDANSFKITAVPVAGTSQASDTLCQSFSVDNNGTQAATDTSCWK